MTIKTEEELNECGCDTCAVMLMVRTYARIDGTNALGEILQENHTEEGFDLDKVKADLGFALVKGGEAFLDLVRGHYKEGFQEGNLTLLDVAGQAMKAYERAQKAGMN